MNNLNSINLTYQYLSDVYDLTKSDYVKRKLIRSEGLQGLNPKSLVKHNILTEYKDTYKWKSVIPQYFHAYNYYNKVRGNEKNYDNILAILKNPENFTPNEIIEALTIKGACALHGLENNKEIFDDNIAELIETNTSEPINIPVQEHVQEKSISDNIIKKNDNNSNFDKLEPILKQFEIFLSDNKIIKELLGDIVGNAMENTTSINNSHNSISKVIAIIKTIQDNMFDISASQYYILREFYANLLEQQSDDPKHVERLEKTGLALKKMKERMDNNVAIVNKYGNGKN